MSYKNGQMHQNLAKKVVKNAVKNGQKLVFLDSFWTRVQLTSPNPKLDSRVRVRVSSLDALGYPHFLTVGHSMIKVFT